MKSVFFSFLLLNASLFTFGQGTGAVRIEGKQFKDENGDDFYPVVCNYLVSYLYNTNSNLNDLYLSPDQSFDGFNLECNNSVSCYSQLSGNFQQIASMGFNTIRIMSVAPIYKKPDGFWITARDRDAFVNSGTFVTTDFFLTQPYLTDPVAQVIFERIDDVLLAAHDNGLKVILIAGRAVEDFVWPFEEDYTEYLNALAEHIANDSPPEAKETLLAYDLFNEPLWSDQSKWPWQQSGHTKEQVCNRVTLWYDAIHSEDPDHLITLGGSSFDDVFEYDDAILKLDFWSPHFYPLQTVYEPDLYDQMMNRVMGNLYWLNKNYSKPFIIGETGFKAEDPLTVGNEMDGSEAEQYMYAVQTLQGVLDCGGSGYSWWIYQNLYWGTPGSYYGLLKHGNCTPPCANLEKDVVDAFQSFSSTTATNPCDEPGNYRDPFNHAVYSPNTNIIHGTVVDEDGNAIEHAVVYGWTLLWIDIQDRNKHYYNHHYTFTDENGDFDLIPFDYNLIDPPNLNTIDDFTISAPGAERLERGWNGNLPVQNNLTYELKRNRFMYDNFLENINLTPANQRNLQGWNTLTTQDVVIQQNVNITISARSEVHLLPGFEANTGSDVHIYLSETNADCEGYIGAFTRFGNTASGAGGNDPAEREIEINFLKINSFFDAQVIPNPNNGMFTISISGKYASTSRITIFNLMGGKVYTGGMENSIAEFDLSFLTRGMYYLQVNNGVKTVNKKIIIQ